MFQPPLALRVGVLPADVSVVICCFTEDRWDDLMQAIASARAQDPREVVVVVDHNEALLARLSSADTGASVVRNTGPQGLSGARNTGISFATGEVVAFLDDDANAQPGWLSTLARSYDAQEVVAVGGAAVARWDTGRPTWFPEEFSWVVGCSWRGLPTAATEVRNLIGANMSMRRGLLDDLGGFSSSLGRVGAVPLGCEETELCIRAQVAVPAGRVLYDPCVAVTHRVRAERATWRYFTRRCLAEGRSKAQVARLAGRASALSSERAYVARVLPAAVLRGLWETLRGDPSGLLRSGAVVMGLVLTGAGYLRGSVRP